MEKNTKDFLTIKSARKINTKDPDGTLNGFLLELVSELDGFTKHIKGQMYMTMAEPNSIKGYHMHALADYYVIVIKGNVRYVAYKDKNTKQELILDDKKPQLVHLPKGHPHALFNDSSEPAYVLMYRYPAWDEKAYKTGNDEQYDIDPKNIETNEAWQDIEDFKKKFA
jgi:dTDP-4-dehydrorhamnose 3,5-epimerase-like enzyme